MFLKTQQKLWQGGSAAEQGACLRFSEVTLGGWGQEQGVPAGQGSRRWCLGGWSSGLAGTMSHPQLGKAGCHPPDHCGSQQALASAASPPGDRLSGSFRSGRLGAPAGPLALCSPLFPTWRLRLIDTVSRPQWCSLCPCAPSCTCVESAVIVDRVRGLQGCHPQAT